MRWTLFVIVLVVASAPLAAQWMFMKSDGDSIVRRGIHHIYNVEFQEAEEAFAKVRSMYPEHPVSYFMDAMVDWWRISLDQRHRTYDAQFLRKIDDVVRRCDELLEKEPRNVTALFFKGGALGFKGRYHAIRKEYIDAANTGRDALNTLEESQKIAPGNHDIMLGTGIYNYFAIVIPERYPLLKPAMLFLPRGDRTLGLLQLKAAASKAQYAHVEAKWILVGAYYDWEKDAVRAMPFAKELAETYPNNPAFQRAYGRCLVRLGPLDKMEALWREVLVNYMDKRTGYDEYAAREALYYIGVRRMIEGDNDIALQYFYKCDEASRLLDTEGPSGFMVKLNLMVGKIYDLQGKRDLAIKQYRKVISMKDYDGTQAEAETYVRTPYRR